jgi:hypothetical protein
MQAAAESVVLEEELPENYEPSEEGDEILLKAQLTNKKSWTMPNGLAWTPSSIKIFSGSPVRV